MLCHLEVPSLIPPLEQGLFTRDEGGEVKAAGHRHRFLTCCKPASLTRCQFSPRFKQKKVSVSLGEFRPARAWPGSRAGLSALSKPAPLRVLPAPSAGTARSRLRRRTWKRRLQNRALAHQGHISFTAPWAVSAAHQCQQRVSVMELPSSFIIPQKTCTFPSSYSQ